MENKKEKGKISPVIIRRLPRYFRYLRILMRQGISRISSGELSKMMGVTASQIRQDFSYFGGFGQQGYGYNVRSLYDNICELLGVNSGLSCVVIGAGDLGRALVRSQTFEKRNVTVKAMFDVKKELIGTECNDISILDMTDLEDFLASSHVDFAVLAVPKAVAEETAHRCVEAGVHGIWNFTGAEMNHLKDKIALENVHLGDSLMYLCYSLRETKTVKAEKKTKIEKKSK